MCVAAAIGGGALLGTVGSLVSSSNQADAAKSAAQTQANAANNASQAQQQSASAALAQQQNQFAQTQANEQPFLNVGGNALYSLGNLFGVGSGAPGTGVAGSGGAGQVSSALQTFQNSPEYQFALNQGTQALDRSAASKGLLESGAQLKDAQAYGQGYASQQFNNYFNQLASLAGIGQAATTATGQFGQQASNQSQADILNAGAARASGFTGAGNANAAGIVGSANALNSGFGQASGFLSGSNLNQLSSLFGSGGSSAQNAFLQNDQNVSDQVASGDQFFP